MNPGWVMDPRKILLEVLSLAQVHLHVCQAFTVMEEDAEADDASAKRNKLLS